MKKGIALMLSFTAMLLSSGCASVAETPSMISAAEFDGMISVTVTRPEAPMPEGVSTAALKR